MDVLFSGVEIKDHEKKKSQGISVLYILYN